MHKSKILILILALFSATFALYRCAEEEVTARKYPRVRTHEVSNITPEGATFEGEITYPGEGTILEHGFVWGTGLNPTVDLVTKKAITDAITTGHFSADIGTALKVGVGYYVRAYARDAKYLVYGKNVTFLSLGANAPVLSAVSPLSGSIGDTVRLAGKNFGVDTENVKVMFDTISASVISLSDTMALVIVPKLIKTSNKVSISVLGNKSEFKDPFSIAQPVINSFIPLAVAIDDTLTLIGNNFSSSDGGNQVFLSDIEAEVVFASRSMIKVIIPGILAYNTIKLKIAGQEVTAANQLKFLEPGIDAVYPISVALGDTVTLTGNNLSQYPEHYKVIMGHQEVSVVTASREEVRFIVPETTATYASPVYVMLAGRTFEKGPLILKYPVISGVTPSVISSNTVSTVEIHGENFSLLNEVNYARIGGQVAEVLQSSRNKIVVRFPELLITDLDVSVIDTVDVDVSNYVGIGTLENGLIINYRNRWTRRHDLDYPAQGKVHAIQFTYNNKGYIGLGQGYTDYSAGESLNDLMAYDPVTDLWSWKAALPGNGRSFTASFMINNKVYIIAGLSYQPLVVYNEVWEYNPALDQWTQKNNFPGTPRHLAFGFAVGGKGYVGGGFTKEPLQPFLDFWEYDPAADSWTQKSNLPAGRGVKTFGFTYNASGYTVSYDGQFWKYNQGTDTWTQLSPAPADWDAAPFVIGQELFLGLGPRQYSESSNKVYRYNFPNNTWSSLEFKGTPRAFASTWVIQNKGYFLLGSAHETIANLRDVWEFDPSFP